MQYTEVYSRVYPTDDFFFPSEGIDKMTDKMNCFTRFPFVFTPPRELKKDHGAKKLSITFELLFYALAVSFGIGYGVTSFENCARNLVSVPYFDSDAISCQCEKNVGISPTIGNIILANTTWGSQFSDILDNGLNPRLNTIEGQLSQITSPYVSFYMEELYPITFTTTVTNQTLHQFELFTGVFDEADARNLLAIQYACVIIILENSTYTSEFYGNDTESCMDYIHANINPNYSDIIDISYEDNLKFQQYCQLQNCFITQCTALSGLNVILFIASTISFCFVVLRLAQAIIFRFWISRNERIEMETLRAKTYTTV